MAVSKDNKALLDEASSYWWLLLLQGIAIGLIGWLLLKNPAASTLVLVQFLGLYWLISGVLDIIRSLMDKQEGSRGWTLFGGVIGIIAGLVVLNSPIFAGILTPTVFLYIIAFAFIINGVIKMFMGSVEESSEMYERSWSSFFLGLFYTIFGIILLAMPLMVSIQALIWTSGIIAIAGGILMVVLSFKLRSAGKKA